MIHNNAFLLYHLGLSQLIFDPVHAADTLLQAVTNDSSYSTRVRVISIQPGEYHSTGIHHIPPCINWKVIVPAR